MRIVLGHDSLAPGRREHRRVGAGDELAHLGRGVPRSVTHPHGEGLVQALEHRVQGRAVRRDIHGRDRERRARGDAGLQGEGDGDVGDEAAPAREASREGPEDLRELGLVLDRDGIIEDARGPVEAARQGLVMTLLQGEAAPPLPARVARDEQQFSPLPSGP
jgi:hypothetical protein